MGAMATEANAGGSARPGVTAISARLPGGDFAALAVAVGWLVVLTALALRRLVVSLDTMSNYAHVWWVAQQLREGHGLPFRMPVLGHGRALTFPYAFVPWTLAALAWPLVGEHSVSIAIALGGAATLFATFYAFPELRRGWWAAVTMANPLLIMAPLAGQLPFLWAIAALLAAIGAWRRGHRVVAILLAAIAQGTHAIIVGPMTGLLVVWWLLYETDRRELMKAYVLSVLVAIPALAVVVASPISADVSLMTTVASFLETLLARSFVIVVPVTLVWMQRSHRPQMARRSLGPALLALAVVANLSLLWPLQLMEGWRSLSRRPDQTVANFARSPSFTAGATYRILRAGDAKVGMYQLLRAGAHLDSELFPESIVRRSWTSLDSYARFLKRRHVDRVIVFSSYDRGFRTNEHRLLSELASATCGAGGLTARLDHTGQGFEVYSIAPALC